MATLTPTMPATPAPLLDTELLRTFVTIAECGSFTRAARQVFRTPSALSMQIKRLEETLGRALFVREARRVRLTPDGEILLGYGRRLLKLNEEAVGRFLSPALEGRLRLGTPDDVGTRILPRALTQFARSHPAVQVDVAVGRSSELTRQLDANELDVALITAGNTDSTGEGGQLIHTEPLVWAARDGGVAAQREPLPLALAGPNCVWRGMALAALDEAGIGYRIAYTSEHCAAQEAAILADLAVAPFPLSLVRAPLRKLGADSGLPPLGEYHIALRRRRGAGQAAEALAEHMAGAFRGD
ncbi:LysR substrate-binding domain-containing protein [Microbulbifer halophilus]|uniref:LysR substrate-binding domain-containing protein n=1 Tax=Microbulbifer halophilus TaxID=453963 RepID=A0ABW5E8D3_9GAMM|nr:LysR substrate-binding domain-containing protein [Microbulbifer halophilus]MCW8125147.1 LysR substrate-binding domain-containing protein [Microbulbifer halophilus]